ncbi:L-rhamnose mutarotase [Nonomuraea endophytica]|uniref:L-rhamnose mutarotase n=1 Tax=Nonomuraea endophytica TaxID=714136 RepID=A0A7W8ABZ2_9ACTN|nr:L-rhamnose mutarotase [Nonomuraea endophytica]MBB5083492.1 L-rhamnose mutarotase [Nonomuraea endophytica]
MERLALRSRLKPGAEQLYDREHAAIPAELEAAMREHGVRSWRIWREGLDLFHLVEVEDYAAFQAAMKDHPADRAWQEKMNRLLDGDFDKDSGGLRLVWEMT